MVAQNFYYSHCTNLLNLNQAFCGNIYCAIVDISAILALSDIFDISRIGNILAIFGISQISDISNISDIFDITNTEELE